MGKGRYCIHAGLAPSGRVVTSSEIIIFLPKLSEKEDLGRLNSQWIYLSIILRMTTLAMRLQFKVSHIPMLLIFRNVTCIPDLNDTLQRYSDSI